MRKSLHSLEGKGVLAAEEVEQKAVKARKFQSGNLDRDSASSPQLYHDIVEEELQRRTEEEEKVTEL